MRLCTRLLLHTCALASIVLAQGPASVKIEHGEVVGSYLPSGVRNWMGIPYAKSPPERFSLPQDPTPWNAPLTVNKAKASCVAQFDYPEARRNLTIQIFSTPQPEESEDCLYVNIWAPSKKPPQEGWPVMFWIYGGNLQFGHGAQPLYSGEKMALKRDVVVVTFNYRTGVFGFSGSSEIPVEANNAGFWDQRKALSWVQKNINQFGGNPKKVLIFGESAGGYSVKQLIANPPSPLPFSAAIMQSQASGVKGGTDAFIKLAGALDCNSTASRLACVRAAPARKIKDIIEHEHLVFGPIQDGKTMVSDVRENIKNGTAAKVPIIIGTNKNEGTAFITTGLSTGNVTIGGIIGSFAGSPEIGEALVSLTNNLYPKSEYPTDFAHGSALFTDVGFQCPTATVVQTFAAAGYNIRRYFYSADIPEIYPFPNAGAWHSGEIVPLFGNYDPKVKHLDNLSNILQGIWTGFARYPDSQIANWPPITPTDNQVREFGTRSDQTIQASSIDGRCGEIGPLAETQGT